VSPLPALATGQITLGCPHQLAKLNDAVLTLWRDLLTALPEARLAFVRSTLGPDRVARLRERLRTIGIPLDRVVIWRPGPYRDYLQRASELDLVLDTFPFNGHTTTCECLWMGLPVVTLLGDWPMARISASLLTSLGLPQLIARTPAQYVRLVQ